MDPTELDQIEAALKQAKSAAKIYRRLTGKPLGITGEIAEFEAARILGLELSYARQPGYDAERRSGDHVVKVQIKGRRISKGAKPGQRIGSIRFEHDCPLRAVLGKVPDCRPKRMVTEPRYIQEAILWIARVRWDGKPACFITEDRSQDRAIARDDLH